MYGNVPTHVAAGLAGATPVAGAVYGSMWFTLALLTIIMVVFALLRLVPRKEV